MIGLDGNGIDCQTSKSSKLDTILKWANQAGKSTGILTTQRVTDATPAGKNQASFFANFFSAVAVRAFFSSES